MLSISPVPIFSNGSVKTATQFQVNSVAYAAGTASASFTLFDAAGIALTQSTIGATAEQCAAWTDDAAFYAVLATNAGLTPV